MTQHLEDLVTRQVRQWEKARAGAGLLGRKCEVN